MARLVLIARMKGGGQSWSWPHNLAKFQTQNLQQKELTLLHEKYAIFYVEIIFCSIDINKST